MELGPCLVRERCTPDQGSTAMAEELAGHPPLSERPNERKLVMTGPLIGSERRCRSLVPLGRVGYAHSDAAERNLEIIRSEALPSDTEFQGGRGGE